MERVAQLYNIKLVGRCGAECVCLLTVSDPAKNITPAAPLISSTVLGYFSLSRWSASSWEDKNEYFSLPSALDLPIIMWLTSKETNTHHQADHLVVWIVDERIYCKFIVSREPCIMTSWKPGRKVSNCCRTSR